MGVCGLRTKRKLKTDLSCSGVQRTHYFQEQSEKYRSCYCFRYPPLVFLILWYSENCFLLGTAMARCGMAKYPRPAAKVSPTTTVQRFLLFCNRGSRKTGQETCMSYLDLDISGYFLEINGSNW